MMDTKKYSIIGLLGLCGVGIVAFFMMRGELLPRSIVSPPVLSDTTLLEAIPDTFDQLVYIDVDRSLQESAKRFVGQTGTGFMQLVERIDKAVVVTYVTGTNTYSLLLLGGEYVDIEELQQLGLLVQGEGYVAELISEDLRMYGSRASLDRQKNTATSAVEQPLLHEYVQQFAAGNYNLGVISSPGSDESLPFMQQFSDQLLYTTVMTRVTPEEMKGVARLQFTNGIVSEHSRDFSPVFLDKVTDAQLLYVEMQHLPVLFGIQKEQFLSLLPIVLGQYGNAYTSLLSREQIDTLWESLSGNIGLFVDISVASPFGVGVSLVFNNPDAYTILETLSPLWHGFLEDMMGSGNISTEHTADLVVWNTTGGTGVAHIERTDEHTIVALGGGGLSDLGGEISTLLQYTPASTFLFRVNTQQVGPMGQLLQAQGLGGIGGVSPGYQGILMGEVSTDASVSQIRLDFSMQYE